MSSIWIYHYIGIRSIILYIWNFELVKRTKTLFSIESCNDCWWEFWNSRNHHFSPAIGTFDFCSLEWFICIIPIILKITNHSFIFLTAYTFVLLYWNGYKIFCSIFMEGLSYYWWNEEWVLALDKIYAYLLSLFYNFENSSNYSITIVTYFTL